MLYASNAFVLMLCGVCFFQEASIRGTILGVQFVSVAMLVVTLEFIQPTELMCWILFYETNLGRGIALTMFSSAALFSSTIFGFISLALSLLAIILHFLDFGVPLPLFETTELSAACLSKPKANTIPLN
jgi:hypothetical protein